ncbi:MAG TPA: glycosyltransferase family 39 protein, partial [Gaiella sp.]|nr:glycosyltransferase family 39 protein [Gaiella sp.]
MVDRLQARLVSPAGAALLVLVALASYAVQALAWPLERGRDSWDYWLTFLQLADRDPPFSALQVFRTPVAPLVTGIPMWLGGARLTEVAFAFLYALSILGWAWAVVPISRRAALATALVLLVTPTYAGLFHEVSSDPVFASIVAWWAGAVVRAWKTGATWWLVGVGVGVALMTLCRPASQVALLACVLVPLVARRGARRIAAGVVVSLAAAVIPLGAWA